MTQLSQRRVALQVDTLQVENLRVQFRVKASLSKSPNTLDMTVTNLSPKSRNTAQQRYVGVQVSAGYAETVDRVFSGDVRTGESSHEGADWNTRIQAGDGEAAYVHARVAESFRAGAKLVDVLTKVAGAMGVGPGNLRKALTGTRFRGGLESFASGYSAFGKASAVMDKLCKAAGLTWSIQGGQLQLLAEGQTLPGDAVLLTSDTGLVGTPEMGTPDKKKGKSVLKAKSLLQPRITPGARVEVRCVGGIRGQFRVESVEHVGDTAGQDWYSEFEGTPA